MVGFARQTRSGCTNVASALPSAKSVGPAGTPARERASNQAMQKLLRTGTIQAKLQVNQPDDVFEREADQIADQVMRMPSPSAGGSPRIQRTCMDCKKEFDQNRIQRLCSQCEEELHRKPRENLARLEISSSLDFHGQGFA